ncbi:cation-translocating P-type ATPase [Spiroplasma floricola]|uniref:Cation-transporting ATPase n=1 Tax=Spiroplasma floricola 23-6 TaxID=1336749 RepID=A0A2K8SCJ0_9MOLU|nr:cation-translocating P-type ATPase [Spiroplasma floricola]AUB31179.1 cation-transporting ATPase [Spiroplasma floricola 23-6]
MNINENKNELSDVKTDNVSLNQEWYKLSNKKICNIFEVNPETGLSNKEAKNRLEKYGRNILPKSKKTNWFKIFLLSFLDPLSLIMILSGLVSGLVSIISQKIEVVDITGLVIILVIVLTNSIIATIQEVKSLNQVAHLNENKQTAIVLRSSKKTEIDIEELVPGDIIFVNSGGFVPADTRILDNQLLKIDESALTGENEPVKKISDSIKEKNLMLGDQKNIAFMSTLVIEGKMMGVIFGTGQESEIGKIATKITGHKPEKTPLERKVTRLTTIIGLTSIVLGLILFLISYFLSDRIHDVQPGKADIKNLLLIAVSSAISLIPESLTIIVKICLMVATKKMARKNVIIKNPKSIETLGNVNVICSDKTGTLTQNKMTVDKIFLDFKEDDYNNFDKTKYNDLINCITLCSDAIVEKEKIGSATEIATIEFVKKFNINYKSIRKNNERLDEIPFDSKRKLMTTVNNVDGRKMVYVKGAVDYLLDICTNKLIDGKVTPLTQEEKTKINEQLYSFAKRGLRVLGFSQKDITEEKQRYENNLTFLGCVAIIDPPREEVKASIEEAKSGGIRVIMITGDHKITAFEIATRLGITDENFDGVLTGQDINELSNEQLKERLQRTNVFARVNPEHKALIVDLLQEDNNIVAMTGDGVNDSPSLVKADVGISMGITGTEVAKGVSDVILADDNFKSIISGVNSGRNVYEKIKYSISFLIAANISQILTLLLILAINQDIALNSVNILFHIFIIETIVAVPIGMQKERRGVMKNPPPTHKKESLLKGIRSQIIITTLFNTLFAVLNYEIAVWWFNDDFQTAAKFGKTGVYIAIMFSPIFYSILYNNFFLPIKSTRQNKDVDKYRPNKWLLILMLVAFVFTTLTLIPIEKVNTFFDFTTVGLNPWLALIFFINSLLPTVCIYGTYKLLLKLI